MLKGTVCPRISIFSEYSSLLRELFVDPRITTMLYARMRGVSAYAQNAQRFRFVVCNVRISRMYMPTSPHIG